MEGGLAGSLRYHAVLAVNDERRRSPPEGGLRSLTAALRRGAELPGNPARKHLRSSAMTTLYVRDRTGFREADKDEVIQQAHAIIARRFRAGSPVLSTPAKTREFLRLHLGSLDHEVFGVLHMDVRTRLIAVEDLFRGTVDSAAVHPREVVKSALRHGSNSLIAYHNHPLCFVQGVTVEGKEGYGLAPSPRIMSRRRGRQAAALLTTASFRCSPEVAARACDGRAAA